MKLKRLVAPRFWRTAKKSSKWIVSPRPGPHKKFESIPLQIIARDILKLVETGKEAKTILKKGEILVDGKKRKDFAYPVGLMDVISIPTTKKYYIVMPSKYGIDLQEIPEKEAGKKLVRIDGKKILRKGKVQLNFHDGKNIITPKDAYKVGDSLILEVPSLKILEHVKLEKGNLALIAKGKNSGKIAKIKEIILSKSIVTNKVICMLDKAEVEVIKDYIFAVGETKPLIKIGE